MAVKEHRDICVVGAGPVGVYFAVRMASLGFTVTVLELLDEVPAAPRAVSHMPVLFAEYKKAGIFEDLSKQSKIHSGGVSYRRTKDQKLIERIPPIPNRPGPMAVPQKEFTLIIINQLKKFKNAELLMGHEVKDIDYQSSPDKVVVTAVDRSGNEKQIECSYLIGADGGKSFVRSTIGLKYEGIELPYKLLAADVFYPFEKYGYDGANFMIDEEDYGNIAETIEIDGERLWRIGCGFPASMSDEEVMNAMPQKFEAMFPGPKPPKYRLLRAQPYGARQLCVPSFRKGRVLLIGDAAHLCNPYSGQLLADGVFDASALSQVLASIMHRGADAEKLLDAWDADRLNKFQKVMDPLSQACFAAVRTSDAESIAQRHPFLKAFKAGPGGGPPPSLESDVSKFPGWVPDADGKTAAAEEEQIQLIWSKA